MLCLSRLNTDVLKRTQRKFLFFWRSPFAKTVYSVCTLYSNCILLRVAHFEAVTSTCHLVLVVQNKSYVSYTGTGQITFVVQGKSYVLHRTNHTWCVGQIMFDLQHKSHALQRTHHICCTGKNHSSCIGQIILVLQDKSQLLCSTNHVCCNQQIILAEQEISYFLCRPSHICCVANHIQYAKVRSDLRQVSMVKMAHCGHEKIGR